MILKKLSLIALPCLLLSAFNTNATTAPLPNDESRVLNGTKFVVKPSNDEHGHLNGIHFPAQVDPEKSVDYKYDFDKIDFQGGGMTKALVVKFYDKKNVEKGSCDIEFYGQNGMITAVGQCSNHFYLQSSGNMISFRSDH